MSDKLRVAYLEVNNGLPLDDFVYVSIIPLLHRGFEIEYYDANDNKDDSVSHFIVSNELSSTKKTMSTPSKFDIFIGSVEGTKRFFKFIGVETPKYLGYPSELNKFYNRNIKLGKISDLRNENLPIFIKPSNEIKMFTGFVLENKKTLDNITMYYNSVTEKTEIYMSEPIDIITEYRCFVSSGKIIEFKHYSGSCLHFIDVEKVFNMIEAYEKSGKQPICYTLDIGLTTDGKTVLIEINDFWAIGSYGLNGKDYVSMIIKRMEEIKRENNI